MEFNQIRYFLAAAETLNFTRAAEACNVTQPALARVDATSQDAMIAARRLLSLDKAPLNVGIMCTIGAARTIPFLSEFQMHQPGIELTLHDVTPCSMTESLLSGALDCALLGLPSDKHERFDTVALYDERMVVIFPPGHRFQSMNAVTLGDLAGELYLDRLNCEFRDTFKTLMDERQIDVPVRYKSEREDWIQTMVFQGMGVCLIPEFSVTVDGLPFRPVIDPEITRCVEMVTVAGHRRSPAVQVFVDAAVAYGWGAAEPFPS